MRRSRRSRFNCVPNGTRPNKGREELAPIPISGEVAVASTTLPKLHADP